MKSLYRLGDKVRITPEWLEPGENPERVYEVVEEDEGTNRVDIAPVEWEGRFRPWGTVNINCIEPIK